jgi:hypothetical protein
MIMIKLNHDCPALPGTGTAINTIPEWMPHPKPKILSSLYYNQGLCSKSTAV